MSVETEAYIIILKKWLAVTDHVNYLRMEIVHQWTIWKENTSRYSVVNTDARWQGTSELQGYHRRWWYLLHLLKEAKILLWPATSKPCGRIILDLVSCYYVFCLWYIPAMAIETKHPLSHWKFQFIVQHRDLILYHLPAGTTNKLQIWAASPVTYICLFKAYAPWHWQAGYWYTNNNKHVWTVK